MKPSHTKAPRTRAEATYTPDGNVIWPDPAAAKRQEIKDAIKGYALAIAIGVGLAALLVAWWSS